MAQSDRANWKFHSRLTRSRHYAIEHLLLAGVLLFLCSSGFAYWLADAAEKGRERIPPRRTCFLSMARNPDKQAEDFYPLAHLLDIAELPDGYGFRFEGTDENIRELNEFVWFERRCCSFLIFELVFEIDESNVWLNIRGGKDIKNFIGQLLPPEVKRRISRQVKEPNNQQIR